MKISEYVNNVYYDTNGVSYDNQWTYPDEWKDTKRQMDIYEKIQAIRRTEEQQKLAEEAAKKQKIIDESRKKSEVIEMIESSIPIISSLQKRQTELRQELDFAVKMDIYSDGLLAKMKEYQENQKTLTEYHQLVLSLAKLKLSN